MNEQKIPIFFQKQVVDNFFENPKEIVEFANSFQFETSQTGFWPGKRTEELYFNHKHFFNSFLTKVLALFFDHKHVKLSWNNVGVYFQKTCAFDDKDKSNILNTGLIHQDGDFPLVGLVYLTEDADVNSGTSIMLPKKKIDTKVREELGEKKTLLYKKSQNKLSTKDLEDYKKLILETNKNFEESIVFNNKFNRLITYAGTDFHRCNSFYSGTAERLTLVFFVKKIQANAYPPLQRSDAIPIKF